MFGAGDVYTWLGSASASARILGERQLTAVYAGGDDGVRAAVLHGGHLRGRVRGERHVDRVGESGGTRLGRPRAKARVAHQSHAARRRERGDHVRAGARLRAPRMSVVGARAGST